MTIQDDMRVRFSELRAEEATINATLEPARAERAALQDQVESLTEQIKAKTAGIRDAGETRLAEIADELSKIVRFLDGKVA